MCPSITAANDYVVVVVVVVVVVDDDDGSDSRVMTILKLYEAFHGVH